MKSHKWTILSLLLSMPVSLLASECYQQSPALVEMGDAYYGLEGALDRQDPDYLRLMEDIADLSGDWQGSLQERECRGPDRAPREELRSAEALVTITIDSSAAVPLRLFLEKTYPQWRFTRREVLDLLIRDGIYDLQIGRAGFQGSVRFRQRTPLTGASRLVEIITTVRSQEGRLNIASDHYSNGILVYQSSLLLHRN